MGQRTADQILQEAAELLQTARYGLDDMRRLPGRAKTGLRNAVVFGRNTTWALQNLRGVCEGFDDWYQRKQEEMRLDPLMRFFHNLRTQIEKQARTPTTTSAYISRFGSEDLGRFPKPPGATSFFIGDQNGGSGWLVTGPDGVSVPYYVELPTDIGVVELQVQGAPEGFHGADAASLVSAYLEKVGVILNEAKQRFASQSR